MTREQQMQTSQSGGSWACRRLQDPPWPAHSWSPSHLMAALTSCAGPKIEFVCICLDRVLKRSDIKQTHCRHLCPMILR